MKYKIDNAGKIFPLTYSRKSPGCFKVCAYLYEDVNIEALNKALEIVINKYDFMKVSLEKGLFWHYLKSNYSKNFIIKETKELYSSINPFKKNSFLFQVMYEKNKISIEFYHALTDANGGVKFLKSLCEVYSDITKGNHIDKYKVGDKTCYRDDYDFYYKKKSKKYIYNKRATKLSGSQTEMKLYNIDLNIKKLKEVCNKEFTITEYLSGIIIYSISKCNESPISLLIPVNARKYYNSNTMRNFMLYIRSICNENNISLNSSMLHVRDTLRNELTLEYLDSLIKSNVSIEQNILINYTPLFLKNILFKKVYKRIGDSKTTAVFSNIGQVSFSNKNIENFEKLEFSISPSLSLPIAFSAISYDNILRLSISSNIKETYIIEQLISILSKEDVIIKTE